MSSDTEAESSKEKPFVTSTTVSTVSGFSSIWILENIFPNKASAVRQLKAEKLWSVDHNNRHHFVQDKAKVNYRCIRANYKPPCHAMKCLYCPNNKNEVWLYKTETKHNHNLPTKKKRNQKWLFEKSFKSLDEGKMYIRQQKIWSIKRSKGSRNHIDIRYRCSLVPTTGEQCAAGKFLRYNIKNREVYIYKYKSPHTHQDIITGLDMYPSSKTDWLLNQLSNNDLIALKQQGFRVLKEVNLQNCLTNPNDCNICYLPNWIFEEKFSDERLALEYLGKDNIWTVSSQKIFDSGRRMVYFQCNQLRLLKYQCDASKCILYSADSEEILVYKKDSEHTHDKIAEQSRNNLQMHNNRYSGTSKRRSSSISKEKSVNDIRLHSSKSNLGKDHINSVKVAVNDSQLICKNIKSEYDSKWVYECDMRNMTQQKHDKITNNTLQPASKAATDKKNDNDSVLFDKNNKWKLETSIMDRDKVLDYLSHEGTWRCKSRILDGSRVFYCCKENSCKADMCLTYKELSNEVLVYRSGDHSHYVHCKSKDLPSHLNEPKLILDGYPNSNIIVKEELIIDTHPALITGIEYEPSYSEENETNSEINVPLIEQHDASLEDETTNNLNFDKSLECTYVSPVSDNSDNRDESLSGDKVVNNLEEWQYAAEFSDYIIAKEYMDNLNLINCDLLLTEFGVKEYYNCKLEDDNGKNCLASHYILIKDTASTITMYKRNIQHADSCTNGISFAMVSIAKDSVNAIDLDDSSDNDENTCIEKTFSTIHEANI